MQQEIMFGLIEAPVENIFQIGLIIGMATQMLLVITGHFIKNLTK